jgi:hypothetical protein
MPKKQNQMVKWMLAAGLLISIASGFVSQIAAIAWISIGLALVSGYFLSADVKIFLAALILSVGAAGLAALPSLGGMFAQVFTAIAGFFAVVAVIPAARVLLSKAGLNF